jgi:hypothetical protein
MKNMQDQLASELVKVGGELHLTIVHRNWLTVRAAADGFVHRRRHSLHLIHESSYSIPSPCPG